MAVQSKDYRIPRADICMSDAMPFSQHWEARIAVPISEVPDMGLALHHCFALMKPGDLVNVCAFTHHDWREVCEVATFRIVSCNNSRVQAHRVGGVTTIPESVRRIAPPPLAALKKVKVTTAGRTSWEVRDEKGNVFEGFVEESQADEMIERETKLGQRPPPRLDKSSAQTGA